MLRATTPGLLLIVFVLATHGASAASELRALDTPTLHTVVPTECTMYFSWQSLGIQYSHRKAGQAGPITRIISCTDVQKQTYKVRACILSFAYTNAGDLHPESKLAFKMHKMIICMPESCKYVAGVQLLMLQDTLTDHSWKCRT